MVSSAVAAVSVVRQKWHSISSKATKQMKTVQLKYICVFAACKLSYHPSLSELFGGLDGWIGELVH